MSDNKLFANDVPAQVIQNIVTAIDPELLTEHTLMLLLHDLSRLLPIEELPHRLLTVVTDYYTHEDDGEGEDSPPTH